MLDTISTIHSNAAMLCTGGAYLGGKLVALIMSHSTIVVNVVVSEIWWYLVILGNTWWYLMVLRGTWWYLVVLGGT